MSGVRRRGGLGWREMPLHPLAESFASAADSYEQGRPDYTPEVVDALVAELGLGAGSRVLDLAAGTGKLTRALLAWSSGAGGGLEVLAVEPQAEMREMLARAVGAERALDGLAERIPLPDRSLDAVTVADAFHWFDRRAALREIARVLRPGGGLAVIATAPDWSGVAWAHALGTLITRERPAHPHFDEPPWQETVRADALWEDPREARVVGTQPASTERVAAYVASMSWVAAMAPERRAGLLERVRALVTDGQTPSQMPFHFTFGLTRLRTA